MNSVTLSNGLVLVFVALYKVCFCVGALCALQCAKNSMELCQQSFRGVSDWKDVAGRVMYNEHGFVQEQYSVFRQALNCS